jgi:GntR family transcriptional regulator, arabinose operon transcriptional repressor
MMENVTKQRMVYKQIKSWILDGKVKHGEQIFPEITLSKMFNVSRQTVRLAIGKLVNEGFLYSRKGAGTFCAYSNNGPSKVKGKLIGVILNSTSKSHFSSIIKGVESYLTISGHSLILATSNNDVKVEKQCIQMMMRRNIDGLIVEPVIGESNNNNIKLYLELEKNNIPYIMINQYYQGLNPPYAIIDEKNGGFLAAEHLINLNHKRIIGIFNSDQMCAAERISGFLLACRENNILNFSNLITYKTREDCSEFIEKIRKLLIPTDNRPTGIICYDNNVVLNVIKVIKGLNLRIPEDISIVGFDESDSIKITNPKLTTISFDKTEIGLYSAKWITSIIENGNNHSIHHQIYNPEIILRETTSIINPIKEDNAKTMYNETRI